MVAILVTVGSTRFDALVDTVLHPDFLAALLNLTTAVDDNTVQLTIQHGSSTLRSSALAQLDEQPSKEDGRPFTSLHFSPRTHRDAAEPKVEIHALAYSPTLSALIAQSDLVISHAGSGTILEVLRTSPKAPALIVVPNHTLMDNHQSELALALGRDGYLSVGHLHSGAPEEVGDDAAALGEQVGALLRPGSKERDRIKPFPEWQPQRFATLVNEQLFG
ncbi:hypothetical protein V8E36_009555 [Tilletia maclaganii]